MTPQRAPRRPPDPVRTFQLAVRPTTGDSFGIELDETYADGSATPHTRGLSANAAQVSRVLDAVLAAVRASGHMPGVLAVDRGRPIPVEEAAGVRLALTLLATQPVTRNDRIRALVAGVNSMSVEESYYWYAKCVGPDASRARKALRVLLADDRPLEHP
jgi:hypothetical protein